MDLRQRDLERRARAGDPEAVEALARSRTRGPQDPETLEALRDLQDAVLAPEVHERGRAWSRRIADAVLSRIPTDAHGEVAWRTCERIGRRAAGAHSSGTAIVELIDRLAEARRYREVRGEVLEASQSLQRGEGTEEPRGLSPILMASSPGAALADFVGRGSPNGRAAEILASWLYGFVDRLPVTEDLRAAALEVVAERGGRREDCRNRSRDDVQSCGLPRLHRGLCDWHADHEIREDLTGSRAE